MPAATASAAGAMDQDDMAFWIHPTDGTKSTLISSDKKSSNLNVYDASGSALQTTLAPGKPGNIDVRYDFPLGGGKVDIVGFNDRGTGKIVIYRIDPDSRMISRVDDDATVTDAMNYGFCLYKSASGKFYGFVTFEITGMGKLQQYELADDGAGKVHGTKVREWTFPTATYGEACVVDDENAKLYYADEPGGIYEVGAEPADPTPGSLVKKVGEDGLTADVEGLAIYKTGAGAGYLLASSQGSSTFKVWDRDASHAFRGSFHVAGAMTTDGIEVTNANIGGSFTEGALAVHGGTAAMSIFLVKWQDVAAPFNLTVDDTYDPRR
jgi:3-phytase